MTQRRNHKGNNKIFWTKWKKNPTYPHLWDIVKAVFRRKFIDLNVYIRQERFQINNLSFHLKKL